jgi:gamma-butyrobetaine dioxygenase
MFFTPTLRAALRLGRTSLTISEHGPGALPQILPYLWLRDACQCPQCIHPQTNSKLFATGTLPLDTAPSHNPNAAKVTKDTLDIQWKDSHTSSYSIPWLLRHGTPSGLSSAHADVAYLSWKGLDVQQSGDGTAFESPFFTSYKQLDTPSGLLKAYNQLLSAGLLFVRGVPTEETSDERCTVRELVGKFGVLRETIYGHVWDVVNRPGTDNIAYTNLNLGLHADMQ